MEAAGNGHGAEDSAEWLRRWQESGDREALGKLLELEVDALKGRLRGRWNPNGSPDFAVSDAAQEAVARLLRLEAAPNFESPQALRAYLWTAAWRLLLERLRQRPGECIDDGVSGGGSSLATSGGHSAVDRADRAAALQVALHLLEPEEQQILELVIAQDLGVERAAAVLGITAGVARTRCDNARRRLAHKLRGWSELIG